ncbi:MAG TPA: hypothetical protein VE093_18535 [Polyangiaceae bacterium]|nr:hypothetical protein [Polyangiaceae bacterium]
MKPLQYRKDFGRKLVSTLFMFGGLLAIIFSTRSAVAAGAAQRRTYIEFPAPTQVCLSKDEEQALIKRLREISVPTGSAVTLAAHSDLLDFVQKPARLSPQCVSRALPSGITDHERLAILRALYITELASKAGLSMFDGPPVIAIGHDLTTVTFAPSVVTIVTARSEEQGSYARRVDVWVKEPTQPTKAHEKETLPAPTPLQQPVIFQCPVSTSPNSSSIRLPPEDSKNVQRWIGVSMISVGVAAIAAGIVTIVAAQNPAGRSAETAQLAAAYQAQANDMRQSGGWALGIGVGMSAIGITLVVTSGSK